MINLFSEITLGKYSKEQSFMMKENTMRIDEIDPNLKVETAEDD